jgi:hypothetical protein
MPMAPQECIDVPCAEAVDSLGHLALERKPPHFAVGHDVEPRCLLGGDGLVDRAILYGFELRVTKTPGHPVIPRFAQGDRLEKTANDIGICRNHRRLRRSDRTSRIDAVWDQLLLPSKSAGPLPFALVFCDRPSSRWRDAPARLNDEYPDQQHRIDRGRSVHPLSQSSAGLLTKREIGRAA